MDLISVILQKPLFNFSLFFCLFSGIVMRLVYDCGHLVLRILVYRIDLRGFLRWCFCCSYRFKFGGFWRLGLVSR